MSYPPVPYPPINEPTPPNSNAETPNCGEREEKAHGDEQRMGVDEQRSVPVGESADEVVAVEVVQGTQDGKGDECGKSKEDEDEDEDDDEEDEDEDWDPENFREEFGETLDSAKSNHQGTYAFHQTYPDAPNPGLQVADLGVLGLPLNPREAEALKSRCKLAPFGKGERTIIDRNVRDTWEVDASMVAFRNPAWTAFVDRTVKEICGTLGVNYDASKPRCELYKLLLYEPGSHFLPHVDTEKANGMFATIVIVLPSPFTGGAAHLSHGGTSTVYDCSAASPFETSVMAWYTDVTHEIKPITAGFRLALSFNLVHTTQALRPALSANTWVSSELHRLLRLWNKDDGERAPEKLVYLLEHKYSRTNLNAGALKGADAHRVALLAGLACEHGIGLGLAHAVCHLIGSIEGDGYDEYDPYDEPSDDDYHTWRYSSGRRRERSPVEYEFDEIEERQMSIEHFVDMDGTVVAEKLNCDESETIPEDLTQDVEHEDHDDEEYQGYQGNFAGSLERWYRRSVLIICPRWSTFSHFYSDEPGLLRACNTLESAQTAVPSDDAWSLAQDILFSSHLSRNAPRVAQAVTRVAGLWGDARLWVQAVERCSPHCGLATLTDDDKFAAVLRFGWQAVRPSFEAMLQKDKHNATRLGFLPRFAEFIATQHPVVAQDVGAWIEEHVQAALKSLRKPEKSECRVLLDAVRVHGGAVFLAEVLLPQLIALGERDFLEEFARRLFADQSVEPVAEKQVVVSRLVGEVIAKTALLSPEGSKHCVQLCTDLSCGSLVPSVFDRVTNVASFAAADAQGRAKTVLLPLVAWCLELRRTSPGIVPEASFEKLRSTGVQLYLDWLAANPTALAREHVATLSQAIVVDGDPTSFMSTVVPKLRSMAIPPAGCQAIAEELSAQCHCFTFPEGYQGETLEAVIQHFSKMCVEGLPLEHQWGITDAFYWCFAIDRPELCAILVQRLTKNAYLGHNHHVKDALLPALPDLRAWGARHNMLDVIAPVFAKTMAVWTDRVLGRLPQMSTTRAAQLQDLARWTRTCSCDPCTRAREVLTQSTERSVRIERIGAQAKKHLKSKLRAHAGLLATWTMLRTTPQGLEIHKKDELYHLVRWRHEQANGLKILNGITSDDAELRRLLGDEHDRVVAILRGMSQTVHAAAARPQPQLPSSSTGARPPQAVIRPAVPAEAGQPPAKRRKIAAYNPEDVIDLT